MKKRLVIISDLWGKEKSEWIIHYTQILRTYFDIEYYDCSELGEVDKSDYSEEKLHQQFIDGGIERAVEKLIELEKSPITILAFSIGGTIAWKYGIETDKIDSLFCVSSTRLRKESIRPNGKIALYFGGNDLFKPQIEWLDNMKLNYEIFKNKDHLMYTKFKFAEQLCKQMIETIDPRP